MDSNRPCNRGEERHNDALVAAVIRKHYDGEPLLSRIIVKR